MAGDGVVVYVVWLCALLLLLLYKPYKLPNRVQATRGNPTKTQGALKRNKYGKGKKIGIKIARKL